MPDEEIREEEPEVEAHGQKAGGDKVEGAKSAHGDEDSDDVEAHQLTAGLKGGLKSGLKGGLKS